MGKQMNRSKFLQTTALVGVTVMMSAMPAMSQGAGTSISVPTQPNTEVASGGSFGATGFAISIDNTPVAGAQPPRNPQRAADIANDMAEVDVRFDGLDTRRLLNVMTSDGKTSYRAGETVTFRASSNYPAFIRRAEVQIRDRSQIGAPVVATVPIDANCVASFTMPSDGSSDLAYALRVYDAQGRYDQTAPLALSRSARTTETTGAAPFAAAGEGEDRTQRRGIPVQGGVITASGTARAGSTVTVMGEAVPVDGAGRFAVSRVLPAGDQVVDVNINGRSYVRDVEIPKSEWFYVGIADLTFGLRDGGAADLDRETYVDGRVAFYTKGKTESGYTITSSLDTGNGPIDDIFARLNDKDPRRVLDRLRSDGGDLYPIYGDDSTFYDDTPTSGPIYLRIENETTRLTFGNFRTGIAGAGLLNNARDLYGLELAYQSRAVTANGDAKFAANVYAAQQETAVQRDILRGTGGSVYFLTRQDITGGSTTMTVQVIDPETGFVVENRVLTEGTDYTVDSIQGVVLLNGPLTSSTGDGGLIDDGAGAYDVNLVAQYEYTPTDGLGDANAFGGRVEGWAGDNLRIGLSAMQENTPSGVDQQLAAADVRYRLGDTSFAELELARTKGPGFARSISTDGGLTIASSGGADNGAAQALRFTSQIDLQEMGLSNAGQIGLRYERKDAGFSTLNEDIAADQTLIGVNGTIALTPRLALSFDAEKFESDLGNDKTEIEVSATYDVNDRVSVEVGVQSLDQTTAGDASKTGSRTDAAARLTYAANDDLTVYGFGQATVSVEGGLSENNRAGLGIDAQVSDAVSVAAEVSGGDTGTAGKLRVAYAPTADNEVYLGYTLDPTRSGAGSALSDRGTVVIGGRHRYSEELSTYAENIYDMPGNQRALTQAYGVTYTPVKEWTLGAGVETGRVRDSASGDFDRTALSFGMAYARDEDLSMRARLEYRTEDGASTAQDRETIALSAGYTNRVADDWTMLVSAEALYSESDEADFRNGEYLRASLGYAYRPLDNERLNVLLRYTNLRDLPGEDQVDANGNTDGPSQRSDVFSVAASYDLNKEFTLGGKLAYRSSEVAPRGTDTFTGNTATLGVMRVDWHVLDQWDIMGEGRVLLTEETGTTETGAVAGVYRHFGDNVKVGVGYEWGAVSDDATDIDYTGQGVFLNIVGKF